MNKNCTGWVFGYTSAKFPFLPLPQSVRVHTQTQSYLLLHSVLSQKCRAFMFHVTFHTAHKPMTYLYPTPAPTLKFTKSTVYMRRIPSHTLNKEHSFLQTPVQCPCTPTYHIVYCFQGSHRDSSKSGGKSGHWAT